MLYKNKDIRSCYSVMFVVFIVGAIMTGLSLLLIVAGAISAGKNMKNVQHIDEVLKISDNHAMHAVYFDITEEPVFLYKHKKEHYYLLTDGNEYRLADINDKEYKKIKSAVEENGTYRVQGMTHYLVDTKSRMEVASKAESLTGQHVSAINMDDILGDVIIENMKLNYWNVFKSGIGIAGIILGIIFGFIFMGGISEFKASRKVRSLSNLTVKDIDIEACKADSLWLDSLRIYLTENMVLGIISDTTKYEGQVALKYGEIQRIYTYNTKLNDGRRSFIVEAIAIDGNKYVLADSKYYSYSDNSSDLENLFTRIKDKNPNVLFEPENVKYKTYRFSYIFVDEYGNDLLDTTIDEENKQEMKIRFDHYNLAYSFESSDAIVSMRLSFPEEGLVDITTGYFGDRANDVEPELYNFLKKELIVDEGDPMEDYLFYDYGMLFKELNA